MAYIYPAGTHVLANVPEGTVANADAGQAVIFLDLITGSSPEGVPTTCVGWTKEFKITKNGTIMTLKQGMPQVTVASIETEVEYKAHFKGFEWNLDLFQKQEGNEAVDTATAGHKKWGSSGTYASKRKSKMLAFHKTLDGRWVWVSLWIVSGDGSFELAFQDSDWFSHDYDWDLIKASEDFEGNALTKNFHYMVDEIDRAHTT